MTPSFTVVIPTFGRPARLLECLRAVERLDYPAFNVVVADDGSPDPVEPYVAQERWRVPIDVVRQPNAGSGAARNLAAERATGEYLAFTADDCTPDADWLAGYAIAFATPRLEQALIGGGIRHALPGDACATASHLLIDYLRAVFNAKSPTFFTPNNMAVHADSFRETGGFDATIGATGEDREFCARWLSENRVMGESAAAVVSHAHPLTFTAFVRQQFSYGVGSARFRARTPGANSDPMPAPLGFYTRLITHPMRNEGGLRGAGLSGLMVVSQIANAAGVLAESLRVRR